MTLKLYVIDSHEQALDIWRQQQLTNAKLLHVDFHCDQRGLLVNQKKNLAYPIWTRFPKVDEGNFLKHAIVDGIIASVRWVHDIPGGRQHDIKTLKYHTDFSAIIHRLIHLFKRTPQTSYRLETCLASQWIQIQPGEILDIDWDFFAAKEYAVDSIPVVCHARRFGQPTPCNGRENAWTRTRLSWRPSSTTSRTAVLHFGNSARSWHSRNILSY